MLLQQAKLDLNSSLFPLHDTLGIIGLFCMRLQTVKERLDQFLAIYNFDSSDRNQVAKIMTRFINKRHKIMYTPMLSVTRRAMIHNICNTFGFIHQTLSQTGRGTCNHCNGSGDEPMSDDGYFHNCERCRGTGWNRVYYRRKMLLSINITD